MFVEFCLNLDNIYFYYFYNNFYYESRAVPAFSYPKYSLLLLTTNQVTEAFQVCNKKWNHKIWKYE